jgi:uncharacterized protein
MNTFLIASTRESAGKTSFILGLAAARKKRYGYLKPFGDRLIYQRKKNWDYDANLIIKLWGLDVDPDRVTLGFNHSKLRFVYDEEGIKKVFAEMIKNASSGMDGLFIEGGKDIYYGASIYLDSLTLARYSGAEVVVVTSGDNDLIMDDIKFINKYFNTSEFNLRGVVINMVHDIEDFKDSFMKSIASMGINVLGVIPYEEKLSYYSMRYLANALFAKVIGGENGLDNVIKNILVGAMSTEEFMRHPVYNRENKLIITSGDRSDMILASLKSDTAGIILTNNIIPPSIIIARATEQNIPLLLVTLETFQVAKQIDRLEALITPEDADKIAILAKLVEKHVDINEF